MRWPICEARCSPSHDSDSELAFSSDLEEDAHGGSSSSHAVAPALSFGPRLARAAPPGELAVPVSGVNCDDNEDQASTPQANGREAPPLSGAGHSSAFPLLGAGGEDALEGGEVTPTSQAEADANLVQQHAEDVLAINFPRFLACFTLASRVCAPAMMVLQAYMLFELCMSWRSRCSSPVRTWGLVTCLLMTYFVLMHQPARSGTLAQRFCCHWRRNPRRPSWVPCRVKVYDCMMMVFTTEWNFLGLYFLSRRDYSVEEVRSSHCQKLNIDFNSISQICALLNLAYTLLVYVNEVGLARLLQMSLSRGLLRTNRAAPEGSLQKSTVEVNLDHECLADHPCCSICLEEFEDAQEASVVMTRACRHPFHKPCLQGWLQVDRTCPLCRQDLVRSASTPTLAAGAGAGPGGAAEPPADAAAAEPRREAEP